MQLDTVHFGIHVHSLDAAKDFYVDKLGLEVIQLVPAVNLLALKAGGIRISIFADATRQDVESAATAGGHIVFRTSRLAATIDVLSSAGIQTPEVSEAPGFMKYISLQDPSGNPVTIVEYLRDPLAKV